jgi:hypothetical protein
MRIERGESVIDGTLPLWFQEAIGAGVGEEGMATAEFPGRRFSQGPRPADFPLGTLESRAAARTAQLTAEFEAQQQQAAQFENLTPLEFRRASCSGFRCQRLKSYGTGG